MASDKTMSVRDLAALPKGHLHLHLEAAMRPETLGELAAQKGVTIPPTAGFSGFSAFAGMYQGLLEVLADEKNLERLIDEAVADAAADGAYYVEFGVSPDYYVETFGSIEASLDRHLEYAAAAGERHGVEIGLMVTVDRTLGIEAAIALANAAASRAGQGVVSLGLANEERGYPASDFAAAFDIAKAAGLQSAPHAGELVGPESVRQALTSLHADRILHGVRASEDETLVAELAERGIPLDVCLTSNVILGVVDDLSQHPLPALLAAGVRCSINADDPILFGPGLLGEYIAAREQVGLTDEQLAECAWTSIETTLASEKTKMRARVAIDSWLATTGEDL
ncbi:adenosine deaminase [Microbacterium endophyticum]|uniref:Adenosine deaminase n=1 Tax=Microbacterium endophyticum TaxID=1526412 RepID=A0A7W4V370_9MICO|nr:adenosine deaminase [Microbacterium endophyticum]MBB2976033.1 adenosine deaminase [Microbacterium endophyticum]NIK35048.1 adenosine deaminase [Microbacterium endophyticum]